MSEEKIKKQIYDGIKRIYKNRKHRFVPGKTKIRYAGQVIDEKEIIAMVDSALGDWFGLGKHGDEFCSNFSKYLGSKYAILANSGSSANLLAVSALTSGQFSGRLNKGDEVITPAATFPTTVNPIVQNGLVPVFVDVELGTYNSNPGLIRDAISDKTKAIMIPHTLGNPNEMDAIMEIAEDKNLIVIEDSCDALGSKYKNKLCGTFGKMGTFSFYPAHHMTMGEGGAVVTNNAELKTIMQSIRDWGRACFCDWNETNPNGACKKRFDFEVDGMQYDHRYVYSNIGYNLKPLDLQAAIGVEQLKKTSRLHKKEREELQDAA